MKYIFTVAALLLLSTQTQADSSKSPIVGVWETQVTKEQPKAGYVEIYPCAKGSDTLCGRIVKTSSDIDPKTGKPSMDSKNENKSLRNRPLKCMQIMTGFKPKSYDHTEYVEGQLYSTNNGKTYRGSMKLMSPNSLQLTGHVFIFSESQNWRRIAGYAHSCSPR